MKEFLLAVTVVLGCPYLVHGTKRLIFSSQTAPQANMFRLKFWRKMSKLQLGRIKSSIMERNQNPKKNFETLDHKTIEENLFEFIQLWHGCFSWKFLTESLMEEKNKGFQKFGISRLGYRDEHRCFCNWLFSKKSKFYGWNFVREIETENKQKNSPISRWIDISGIFW